MGQEQMGSMEPLDPQRSCRELEGNDGFIYLMERKQWKSNKTMVMQAGMFGVCVCVFQSLLQSPSSGTILLLDQVIFLKNSITKG